jgi:hypothetical protein
MDTTTIVHQALLYAHIIFFALAMATILREDCRLLFSRRIDPAAIWSTAETIKWLLLALWISGLLMIGIDIGLDGSALLGKPKLMAKLTVVAVLTLNGALLHFVAFPILTKPRRNPRLAARLAATLGAVSTTSWLYASFLGVARLVAPYISLKAFLGMYVLALVSAATIAVVLVSGRLERMMPRGLDQGRHGPLDHADISKLSRIWRQIPTSAVAQALMSRSTSVNEECTEGAARNRFSKAMTSRG